MRDGGGEKVVGLAARGLGGGKAAGGDEERQDVELAQQLGVELPPALIARERLMTIGRRVERVPADKHHARLFLRIETHQEIRKADDGTTAPAVAPPDRFRQGVVGAVGEQVAIDDQQRPAHPRSSIG